MSGKKKESKPRRFRFWVYLNAAGMKLWGDVFPDGVVPVVSMIPKIAVFKEGQARFYLVFHEEMSGDQISGLTKKLAIQFDAPEADVRAQMLKDRIPLREMFTDGAGTDGLPLFV